MPAVLSGGTSFATDPQRKIGRNYVFDFTVQRELPGKMIMEVGYVGRLGRDLPQGQDLDASPYFFKDSASGQTFAQAFDAVALALRSGDAAPHRVAGAGVVRKPVTRTRAARLRRAGRAASL